MFFLCIPQNLVCRAIGILLISKLCSNYPCKSVYNYVVWQQTCKAILETLFLAMERDRHAKHNSAGKPDATAQRQNNKDNILMGLTPAVCFVPNKQPYCLATPHNLPCSSCRFTLSNQLSFVHSRHQQLLGRACIFIVFNSKDI